MKYTLRLRKVPPSFRPFFIALSDTFQTFLYNSLQHSESIESSDIVICVQLLLYVSSVLGSQPLSRTSAVLHELVTPESLALAALQILRAPLQHDLLDFRYELLFDA